MPASPSRSRPIIRRPAAPAATAIRPRPGCSGAPRISPAPAAGSRPRSSRGAPRRRARAAQRARQPWSRPPAAAARILLRHFGEDPPERCGNCDNCLAPPVSGRRDRGAAQKLLSAAFRTEMRFGIGHLDRRARRARDRQGAATSATTGCRVFGIADEEELALIKPVARALLARDALRADDYGGLSFGPAAQADPEGRGEARARAAAQARSAGREPRGRSDYPHDPLFEALRAPPPRAGRRGGRAALCHLPRQHAARDGGAEAGDAATRCRGSAASARPSSSAMARPSSR